MVQSIQGQVARVSHGLARRGSAAISRAGRTAHIVRALGRSTEVAEIPHLVRRARDLVARRRFGLEEAYVLGLLDLATEDERVATAVSKRQMIAAQARLNPNELWYLTEDKAVFYRYAELLGVPVPRLFAVLSQSGPGWSWNDRIIAGRDDWESLFDAWLPDTFVVKPARGYYGLDVRVIERRDGLLHDVGGASRTARGLCDELAANRQFHIFVVQERLTNRDDMPGGRPALQTARIATLVERDGTVSVINAFFKSSGQGAAIDNFRLGATGNVVTSLDPSTGRFQRSLAADPSGVLREVRHPTGAEGFPMWEECCELVKSTALHFLPMRSLGWDVAVTPSGPVVVEANMWWDPVGSETSISEALAKMERD